MDHRVQLAISFVEVHLHERIALNEVSRMVNLSPWRLCHLFKAETGMSLIHFVHTLRMKEAKNLLETTFLSVKEIRAKIGATDESHFIGEFERTYGMAPSRYRLRHWQAHADKRDLGNASQRNSKIGK